MKKNILLIAFFLFCIDYALAQAPLSFKYQAIARNSSGSIISNQDVSFKISILKGNSDGEVTYSEIHETTTNDHGLVNLGIGNGNVTLGALSEINWGDDAYFVKIELDEQGASNYIEMGVSQLLSVPYALFANSTLKDEDPFWNKTYSNLYYEHGKLSIGDKADTLASFTVTNNNPIISDYKNTAIAEFQRKYGDSKAQFLIYGYPDTEKVYPHMRESVMLYATGDAKSLILCATQPEGTIKFFTQNWIYPSSERMRIESNGNIGIGTTNPKTKFQVSNGDVYIENVNSGVIMKSPNGKCWRMTVSDGGTPEFTAIPCP